MGIENGHWPNFLLITAFYGYQSDVVSLNCRNSVLFFLSSDTASGTLVENLKLLRVGDIE